MIGLSSLPVDFLSPSSIAWASRGLTAAVGLFVAVLAYRGYQRNGATKMRMLAIGIGLLTSGVFVLVTVVNQVGGGPGGVLLARGIVTVTGLSAVLYALLFE
jgi:hypothetical protein